MRLGKIQLAFAAIALATVAQAGANERVPVAQNGLVEAYTKLDYVNSIVPPDVWVCRAAPRTSNTAPTQLMMAFIIPGMGDITASARNTVTLNGRSYSGNYRATGTAVARVDGSATIRLDSFEVMSQDQLPNGYDWSDPSQDIIELQVVADTASRDRKPYMMVGTQSSEFGTNDLTCIAFDR